MGGAAVTADHRGNVVVIPADGDFNVTLIGEGVVGRIKT